MARPRVVIIGGGFGGLACARLLAGGPVDVLLIDRRDYHQFTPLLYQVASALLTAADISYPFRAAFRDTPNIQFLHADVSAVDLDHRIVHLGTGRQIGFDYLVLATGSENNYFGNAALGAHTLSMKTLPEAQRLRNHVLTCLERAAQAPSEGERRRWLTFVVIGGGPTGVEFTGALLELLKLVLGREYPELPADLAHMVLIEGTDHLLATFPKSLRRYARSVLERRGVQVLTGTLVDHASADDVVLADGRQIPTHTVVWSAGIHATRLPGTDQLAQSRTRRLSTDDRLRIAGLRHVFAVGDVASVHVDGRELPMLSPFAMQAGRYVARAIVAEVRGVRPPGPFRPRNKGTMAVIGRNAAVASIGRLRLTGLLGWGAWLTVHIYYLIGFRNRTVVLLNWAWNYVRKDRPIRIITTVERDPLVDELTAGHAEPRGP